MKQDIIILETYGIIAIYEVLNHPNNNKVVENLQEINKSNDIDTTLEEIFSLVDKNLIRFLFESEVAFDINDYTNKYIVLYHIKY